ncbi:MAG TPA: hypothetical protein VF209_01160 [Patescibacteria group bacterium]
MSASAISFPYEVKYTTEFGSIPRPVAEVSFLTANQEWRGVTMVIDTGADLTLLPSYLAVFFEIDIDALEKIETRGIKSSHTVYLMRKMRVKIGFFERSIPVGFVRDRRMPPLLGRHQFLETFVTTLEKDKRVIFAE